MISCLLNRCKPVGDCLEWQGGKDKDGYGLITIRSDKYKTETYRAHRLSVAEDLGLLHGEFDIGELIHEYKG